jgi:hypothetical protein
MRNFVTSFGCGTIELVANEIGCTARPSRQTVAKMQHEGAEAERVYGEGGHLLKEPSPTQADGRNTVGRVLVVTRRLLPLEEHTEHHSTRLPLTPTLPSIRMK